MIDLHTHTDQSDGSVPPHRLVYEALALGLEALAITDHDTLAGYDLAKPAAAEAGLELLCGIELSTRLEQKTAGPRMPSVHLLGYFIDTGPAAAFRDWLRQQQESRRKRNLALVAKLQSLGVDITLEEVQAIGRNLTGRPHFARVLVAKGYVSNSQEAFDLYLADHARAAVEREEPTLSEGIRRIRAGGGLPSLAHPVRLPQREPASLRALLAELCEAGLQGIEVYHSEHSRHDTEFYLQLASEFGLAATGGSDFHGDNKPSIHLGSGRKNNLHLPYALLDQIRAVQASARSQTAPAT